MPSHKQSPELKQRVVRTVLEWRRDAIGPDCGFRRWARLGVHLSGSATDSGANISIRASARE